MSDILRPGETCWRIERASRMAMIVDAADYFLALREAVRSAKRAVYMVGWDFDLRIDMTPGQEGDANGNADDGMPRHLGDFIVAVAKENPDLDLHILKWDGAMLASIGKQVVPTILLQLFSDHNIHFALDSHHPLGACHHSKIVVIDDELAFCGGIDATEDRWDTSEHKPDDPRRTRPDGSPHEPWHDVTACLEGPVARALGDLSRRRWHKATGEELEPCAGGSPGSAKPGSSALWPDRLEPNFRDVDVAIARTEPRYHGDPLVNEIEELYLAAIRAAKETIYLESQYLAAGSLCDALEARLQEPDGPELVVVNPQSALSFMEDEAMHSVRARMIRRLRDADTGGRFRIFYPANSAGTPIYVHAKVLAIDDRLLRLGSSNVDNRSMGFDTECDVAVEASSEEERQTILDFRHRLLAEHMGCAVDDVARAAEEHGSLVGVVEALNGRADRQLKAIEPEPLDPLEVALADSRLFDPRYYDEDSYDLSDRMKHKAKRAVSPYHVSASLGGTALVALIGAGAVGFGVYALLRRRKRSELAAPAIIHHRTL